MKLSTSEKCAIILTVLFLVFTAGVHAGERGSGDEVYISTAAGSVRPDGPVRFTDVPMPSVNEALSRPVNINTADAGELMTLSGIGEKLAGRIIAYREENGAFERPRDITLVPGIGDGIYSKICTDITT